MNPLTKFRYETVKILITGFIVMAVLTAFIAAKIIIKVQKQSRSESYVLTICTVF